MKMTATKNSYSYDLVAYFKQQARRAGWPRWQVEQVIDEARDPDRERFEEASSTYYQNSTERFHLSVTKTLF